MYLPFMMLQLSLTSHISAIFLYFRVRKVTDSSHLNPEIIQVFFERLIRQNGNINDLIHKIVISKYLLIELWVQQNIFFMFYIQLWAQIQWNKVNILRLGEELGKRRETRRININVSIIYMRFWVKKWPFSHTENLEY